MSVQFGRWNFDGRPVEPSYLEKAGRQLVPFGPDAQGAYIKDNVGILFHAFHTTKESRRETQPHITPSGAVLSWDGRLDNRAELIGELRDVSTDSATDVSIVTAAYEKWGTHCLGKLIGDWALSIWNPNSRSLILAKDPIGTRHLYYLLDKDQVTWSTILDPLVLFAGKSFALEEEYIAGWLSFFPATHLTPYVGIHSVSPSCIVRLEPEKQMTAKYWDFDPSNRIRYRTDGEYEEHFRQVFAEAVRRRLRSDSPVLAELSGGMDSSSIVCMADAVIARGDAGTSRLDTVSSYSDSEPNWNERPYFTKVEDKRGRVGCHIDVGNWESFSFEGDSDSFAPIPAASGGLLTEAVRQLAVFVRSRGNRVLLSGVGGDEVLGGVPTAVPELADLTASFHWKALMQRAMPWALSKRQPVLDILRDTFKEFLPSTARSNQGGPAALLDPAFFQRNSNAISGYSKRLAFFGPLPSFQQNTASLEFLRRQLSCTTLRTNPCLEPVYPYLDRDLLAFLFATPREQVVRPGRRRSLMRRSLGGIVPPEILERRRKAFVSRGPTTALINSGFLKCEEMKPLLISELGIVCPRLLAAAIRKLSAGGDVSIVLLLRTMSLERWLVSLCRLKLIDDVHSSDVTPYCADRKTRPALHSAHRFRTV